MARFKNEAGEVIIENTRKMKIERDGVIFKRITRPAYKSRQARLDEVITDIRSRLNDLEDLEESIKDQDYLSDEVSSALFDFDIPELNSLASEMRTWRDNLRDTNLENTYKYDDVRNCHDALDSVIKLFSSIEPPTDFGDRNNFLEELDTFINDLDSAIQELEGIYFPGMFD